MKKINNNKVKTVDEISHFAKARGYTGAFGTEKYMLWYFFNYILIILARIAPYPLVTTFHRWRGAKIGYNVYISRGACIDHSAPQFIEIGNHVTIAYGAVILAHNREGRWGLSNVSKTKIGNNVFIGANAVILPGTTIGDGAIVGACSLVNKSVKPYTIVGGVPAKVIRGVKKRTRSKNGI
ncbi:MAG: acyltransferase [Candidatus Heimdallarchaeota archaeon]|nr:MAG: acyltransferase [Candidatus Heimdallarchaeota archaeon]